MTMIFSDVTGAAYPSEFRQWYPCFAYAEGRNGEREMWVAESETEISVCIIDDFGNLVKVDA